MKNLTIQFRKTQRVHLKSLLSAGILSATLLTNTWAQGTSDAVYTPQSSNTAKFYKTIVGQDATSNFTLGDAVFVQFLFTEHPIVPEGEHTRVTVSSNGKTIAFQDFKSDDALLPVYFSDTYSFDLNVIANSDAFNKIKSITEATATDRSFSVLMNFPAGLYRPMMLAAFGKMMEGSHTIKVALETGKDVYDEKTFTNNFVGSKVFSSVEFTLKVTNDNIETYRKDILTNFGDVINTAFLRVNDNGVKSDIHKQNLNKIVFSNTTITDASSSSSLKTSFSSLNDGIYGKVFLPRSIYNYGANGGRAGDITSYDLEYYLDGQYVTTLNIAVDESKRKSNTSYDLGIAPTEITETNQAEVYNFAKTLVKAKPGNHKFKVVVSINYLNYFEANNRETAEIATGEFDLNVVESEKMALLKKLCPKFEWINNHVKLVPDAFSMIDNTKRVDEKVLKVVVYDNDWTYQRNWWGVILSRTIRGKGIIQNTKTNLCFEIDILFSQQNTSSGGSGYSATQFVRSGEYDNSVWFSQECIK